MLKKRNLIFISLLILGVFLITSCLPKPPVTEGILKGQIMVPEGSIQAKDLTGQALPEATVNIIDPTTGDIIATTTTDADGYYQVFVPAGGPYLLRVVKDGVVILQITPQVEVGIEYDLGTADCSTTAVALIALAMMDAGANLADINLADIAADPNFDDVLSSVTSIIEAGGDPTESAVVQQVVEDFLSPPAPPPPPAATLTYTVTYNGNGSTGGTVPSDANNYEQGDSVTVLGNTGNLEKTQDGISLLFIGWNTAANGSGTSYNAADTFNMGNANVTLFAQWSVLRGTGPAGGLIFYDKGSVSDGWRYLEAAPSDQSTGGAQWGCSGTLITGADGTAVGTGKQNTIDIEAGCTTADTAADICANLSLGSYSDWFLPSKEELNLMYTNLKVAGVGGFEPAVYWSSSEDDAIYAWRQYFYNGSQGNDSKNYGERVRAVRAFRSTAPTYLVNYNANGATSGTAPSDGYHYEPTDTVTVIDNTGNLVKTDYIFADWNTAADGTGIDRAVGSTFNMGSENVTLYAQWTSSNATLSDLSLSSGTLDPSFASAITSYTAAVANNITSITVTPTATDTNATITVNTTPVASGSVSGAISLNVGENTITIVVTAEDGTTTKTYTVTVTRTAIPITAIDAITGTAKVGAELTAGALTPSGATATYQWQICATSGGTYEDIGGATSITYTPVADDVTKFIKVVATGTGSYSGTVTSTATAAVANGEQAAPTGLTGVAPTTYGGTDGKITGTTTAMEYKLSTEPTTWTPATVTEITDLAVETYHVRYAAKAGFNAGTAADVVVPALAIGHSYGGGIVAYILQSGDLGYDANVQHGLIATTADQSTSCAWSNITTILIGTTGTSIGTGLANTTAIIGQSGHTNSAAKVCYDYSVTVSSVIYDDWFLPSRDELYQLYINQDKIGGFAIEDYWSSSESLYAIHAWFQYFGGTKDFTNKSRSYWVRAVRAF